MAIKLHFGEKGNTAFVRPIFLRRCGRVKKYKGKPFLTDTNTLYVGTRAEAISHLTTAYQNGFAYSVVDAPLLIADGLRGNSAVKVRIDKPLFKTVSIAHAIHMADVLISVAHFKGHELSGFGGTLKNLGMGCASREGKLSQHSNISPRVKGKTCKGCELCLTWCPQDAISIVSPRQRPESKTVSLSSILKNVSGVENASSPVLQGLFRSNGTKASPSSRRRWWNMPTVLFRRKRERFCTSTFSHRSRLPVIVMDIPILRLSMILESSPPKIRLQSIRPLWISSMARRETVLQAFQSWEPGEDKFRALYPEVDWSIQLSYAEEIGLGTREYELIKI